MPIKPHWYLLHNHGMIKKKKKDFSVELTVPSRAKAAEPRELSDCASNINTKTLENCLAVYIEA